VPWVTHGLGGWFKKCSQPHPERSALVKNISSRLHGAAQQINGAVLVQTLRVAYAHRVPQCVVAVQSPGQVSRAGNAVGSPSAGFNAHDRALRER